MTAPPAVPTAGPECVMSFSLAQYDITVKNVVRNASPALLYEYGLRNEAGTAISSSGALIAMSITAIINWRFQRDFAREWVESLRVKHKAPLGEDELARMTRKHK